MITINGKYNSADIFLDEVDQGVLQQLYAMLNSPAFENGVIKIMPDCHVGKGALIGFTYLQKKEDFDKVCPNVIGVDIGCGIDSADVNIAFMNNKSFADIDKYINRNIPHGFSINTSVDTLVESSDIMVFCEKEWAHPIFSEFVKNTGFKKDTFLKSLGTLGGGNHFIEIGSDESHNDWITVHSGSRNFGFAVANYFQKLAKKQCEDNNVDAPRDLSFLNRNVDSDLFDAYIHMQRVAVKYAMYNREVMLSKILSHIHGEHTTFFYPRTMSADVIYTTHNYINEEDDCIVIRKGATSSRAGKRFIVPLNMRDGVLVLRAESPVESWNYSAPHGAGRAKSRSKAKEEFTLDDFRNEMSSVYSTSVRTSTIDESPGAYKDKSIIFDAIKGVYTIESIIKSKYNFKAN